MPVDADGNRAEVIADTDSVIKRMNLGRLYEHFITAACRDMGRHIADNLPHADEAKVSELWNYLREFYQLCSPRMMPYIDSITSHYEHLTKVAQDGVYLYLPTDNPVSYPDVVKQLIERFPLCYGPVSYIGASGVRCTTERPVLIGGLYTLLLEKTGRDWSAVSSAKLQHFGIPSKITRADKHTSPARKQPVRIFGESETRLMAATLGGEYTVDLLDQSNNPETHKHIVKNILSARNPIKIKRVVDRKEIPLGNSRIQMFIRHTLECGGIKFIKGEDYDRISS